MSATKEFFKGFFWPSLFGFLGFVPFPFQDAWQRTHDHQFQDISLTKLAIGLAVIGTALLVVRWWKRARWRAYGAIAGLFAAPAILFGLFVACVVVFKITLFAR